MNNKLLLSILLVFISGVSAMMEAPVEDPAEIVEWVEPIIRLMGGDPLPIKLNPGSRVLDVLLLYGSLGHITETVAQGANATILSYCHPLKPGKDYTFVKTDHHQFFQHLIDQDAIAIQGIYGTVHEKVTCNEENFVIKHHGPTEPGESFDQSFSCIDLYNGTGTCFDKPKTFLDILFMIFFTANRKDEILNLYGEPEALLLIMSDFAKILDVSKGERYWILRVEPFGIDLYKDFVRFASLCKMITPVEADTGFKFLEVTDKAFTAKKSPEKREQLLKDLQQLTESLDASDRNLIQQFISLDLAGASFYRFHREIHNFNSSIRTTN